MASDEPVAGMVRALCASDNRREFDCCGQCRDKTRQARVAWAYAVAAMDELYPDRVARDVGPGVLETLLWAEDALHHEGIGPDLGPLIEMLRLACAGVEPSAGAVTPSAAPPGGQERASAADEGDGTGG